MNLIDILLLLIIAGVIFAAFRIGRSRRAKGKCTCGCSGCASASACSREQKHS